MPVRSRHDLRGWKEEGSLEIGERRIVE